MAEKSVTLEKNLGALDVYALTTGAALGPGLFLLPGLAAAEAGPALTLAYALAGLSLLPALLAMVELMTAMPRAGGIYYYLDRSLGPVAGTVGGLGVWLVLVLKVAFALIGMGAYLAIFFPELPVVPVAVGLTVAAGLTNVLGAKLTGGVQVFLLAGLLAILAAFTAAGLPRIDPARFRDFLPHGWPSLLATTGLVYVSYVGLIKIPGMAEEVTDPERNLPLGVFLALGTALLIYGVGTVVIVGVLPMDALRGDLTAMATAGEAVLGEAGLLALTAAAFLAFAAVTNAGMMSASRYPLAMSRDHILPRPLEELGERGTPARSIALTVVVTALVLVFLDPMEIAELASAFLLLVFSLMCLAVIVMRESAIEAYDPGYRSPAYPWLQVAGILMPLVLIVEMGWEPLLFTVGMVAVSVGWYWHYSRERVTREGAIFHIFARLGRRRDEELETEMREILKEKGLREADPFARMVGEAPVVDVPGEASFEEVVADAAERLADRLPVEEAEIASTFLEETALGVAPVSRGAALPHMRLASVDRPHLLIVRSRQGLRLAPGSDRREDAASADGGDERDRDRVHAVFFLVSPESDARQHLRMLAKLAEHVERDDFLERWLEARDHGQLKEILVEDEQAVSLRLDGEGPTARLVGRPLGEARLPDGIRVALLRRRGQVAEATDDAVLERGDRITLLGERQAIEAVRERFGG